MPRVAYLPDTYVEVNGVAQTARQLTKYARSKSLPFLCVRPGNQSCHWQDDSVDFVELRRSRFAIRVEQNLWQDPAILRYVSLLRMRFRAFRPDIAHVTSMGDFGLLGWRLAREFKVPMIAARHTNVHEYAAWRFLRFASFLPRTSRRLIASGIECLALSASIWFYRKSAAGLAPNFELVELLRERTRSPTFLMERGVDTALFAPHRRCRHDSEVMLGYVGRQHRKEPAAPQAG